MLLWAKAAGVFLTEPASVQTRLKGENRVCSFLEQRCVCCVLWAVCRLRDGFCIQSERRTPERDRGWCLLHPKAGWLGPRAPGVSERHFGTSYGRTQKARAVAPQCRGMCLKGVPWGPAELPAGLSLGSVWGLRLGWGGIFHFFPAASISRMSLKLRDFPPNQCRVSQHWGQTWGYPMLGLAPSGQTQP